MNYAIAAVDALELLRSLPDQSVAVTLTDPPYNEASKNARSVYDGKASDSSLGRSALGVKGEGIAWALGDEQIGELVAEALRVTRRWVVIFCALEHLGIYQRAACKAWKRAGIWSQDDEGPPFFSGLWDRNNTGTPQLTGDRPAQGAEGIAIMHSPLSKPRWNGGGSRGIWRHSVDRTKGRHPAAKPLPLARELVKLFSDPGDLILDPYCGGASFGVAALEAGRQYLGNDTGRDLKTGAAYADTARARLAEITPCD